MIVQIRLLFLLSILFTASFANFQDVANNNESSGKISAILNKLFDTALPSIQMFILKHKLDPMKLDDLSQNLKGVIIHHRTLNLTNGSLQGLSNVRRANDIILSFENKILTLDATLGFDDLKANYNYHLYDLLINKKGKVYGYIKDIEMRIIIDLDMNNYKVAVPMAKIIKLDKFDIAFKGNIDDPIINAAIKAITKIFRTSIINMVNTEFSKALQEFVGEINKKIPQPNQVLDNDNIWHYLKFNLS
ncbi:uncharacterized protein LOC100578731 [Apis mellifera]|uniref:Uncharacterized protein LOC100578731 n=1 Tax=Apis mellifera TaxID=7460 RepID=A0A7M7GAS3_APIME|nr:uncharacterized protein LOC100578731 [Apis mellifera]|eukprot:XP_003250799.1 uncharacterized protein LOC100578731 [Apis mellifera]